MTKCKLCGAPIVYVCTLGGRTFPCDASSVAPGRNLWDGSQVPHSKTCTAKPPTKKQKRDQDQLTITFK